MKNLKMVVIGIVALFWFFLPQVQALFLYYEDAPVQITPGAGGSSIDDEQNDFSLPPVGDSNIIQEEPSPSININWLPWITSDPQQAIEFVNHGISTGETELQRQAVADKFQELLPEFNQLLSQSAQVQFRMGFGNDGSFLMEYKFVNDQGKPLADVVFKNSEVAPPSGVFHAWKRTQTSVKLYDPETGNVSREISITAASDDSNNIVVDDKTEGKKFVVKPDGSVVEEEEKVEDEVDEWLDALKDSDPQKQASAVINLCKWLKDNHASEKIAVVENALIETIPALMKSEELNDDKKLEIIGNLVDTLSAPFILSKVEASADEPTKKKIYDLMGELLKDYFGNADFTPPGGFDAVDPRVVCVNYLLKTEYGRNILKDIAACDDSAVVENFTSLIGEIFTASLNPEPPEFVSQERIDKLTDILLSYPQGKEKLTAEILNYAQQATETGSVQLRSILTSIKNLLGTEGGKEFLDGIQCSEEVREVINQVWQEITTPQEDVDSLIKKLNDDSLPVEERIKVAEKLAETGDEKAINALLGVWKEYQGQFQDNPIRIPVENADHNLLKLGEAITPLLVSMDDKIIPFLRELYNQSDNPFWTYMDILDVAHNVGSKNALALIKDAFTTEIYDGTSKDWTLKGKAKGYLLDLNREEAREFFDQILSQPQVYSELSRRFAVKGLADIGDDQAQAVLLDVLQNDTSESIKVESARALAELENVSAVEPILEQFISPSPVYRKEFNQALKELVDKIEDSDLKALTLEVIKLYDGIENKKEEEINTALEKLGEFKDLRAVIPIVRLLSDYQGEYAQQAKTAIKQIVSASPQEGLQLLQEIHSQLSDQDSLKPALEDLIAELQPPQPPQEGPVTVERIYKEFGIRVVAGDETAIDYMYRALEENYNLHRPQNFDPKSIMYANGVIPQQDLESIYRILKTLPPEFARALRGKVIKLFSNVLPTAEGGGIGGATYIEEPQIEKDNIYIFFSKALESSKKYKDSFEEAVIHELMHVIYQTGLSEEQRSKISENFWHGESDVGKVVSNLNDFADPRIGFYKDKPNPVEIIMEDWAYLSTSYIVDSLALIEKALVNTNTGCSTPVILPDGSKSSVLKEKVKFIANLLSHEVNGQIMTYVFKLQDGKLLRAEVLLGEDGLPVINGDVKWEEMR